MCMRAGRCLAVFGHIHHSRQCVMHTRFICQHINNEALQVAYAQDESDHVRKPLVLNLLA
jgi:hypothetical protein